MISTNIVYFTNIIYLMNIWKFREKPWNKTILLKFHVFKIWYWVQVHISTNVFRGISNVFELSYKTSTKLKAVFKVYSYSAKGVDY